MRRNISAFSIAIICIMIIAIFLIVYLFRFQHIDPQTYGPIGDSVGGLVGPFLSMITIIFIYETFRTERRRVRLDEERIQSELINARIERIHKSIDDFTFSYTEYPDSLVDLLSNPALAKVITIKGIDAIEIYYEKIGQLYYSHNPFLLNLQDKELESLYVYSSSLLKDIEHFQPFYKVYRDDLIYNVTLLFYSKLYKMIYNINKIKVSEDRKYLFKKTVEAQFQIQRTMWNLGVNEVLIGTVLR